MKLQKETESSQARHGRWYADACGTAFALELVGERWSLLIVRELMLGGLRFSDLRTALSGISAKVLSERLASLEAAGVLAKRRSAPPGVVQVYELTEWGYHAEPAIAELGRWAARSPRHDPTLPLSPVALMLSLRSMVDRAAAEGVAETVGVEVGGQQFTARLEDGVLAVARGEPPADAACFRAEVPLPLLRVFYGHQPIEEGEATGELTVEGDRAAAGRFAGCFALPPKVGQD